MFKSTFLPEHNILYTRWDGKISKDDILSFVEFLNKHDELPRRLKTLEMLEAISLDFDPAELQTVAAEMKRILGKFTSIRSALVSNQPLPVAYSMMYKGLTEEIPQYQVEVFDVEERAMDWLI